MDKLVETIVEAIQSKKGENVAVLDLSDFEGAITKYFVICNAESTVQVAAIAAGVEDDVLKNTGERAWRVHGLENSLWVAIDYGDVMVHVFQTEMRAFYRLEDLWADAPVTRYED